MNDFAKLNERIAATVSAITERDRRYASEAYLFVMNAVESSVAELAEVRHISGRELCEGIRQLALKRFGPMAKEVLNFWGVRATEDFGNIVFNLVDAGLLRKTEEDSLGDFVDVYDFETAFEQEYDDA